MVKLVDAVDSKSTDLKSRAGSSPASGTIYQIDCDGKLLRHGLFYLLTMSKIKYKLSVRKYRINSCCRKHEQFMIKNTTYEFSEIIYEKRLSI